MGFRTVVILDNNHTREWSTDPKLGEKIVFASANVGSKRNPEGADLDHGRVIECCHQDIESLIVLNGLYLSRVMAINWNQKNVPQEEANLRLIKEAANNLGYRLVKKSVKKK